jgi:hypothetical protein
MNATSFVDPIGVDARDCSGRGDVPRILSRHARQWAAIDQVVPEVTQLE